MTLVITTYLTNLLSPINLDQNPDGNHALEILNELNPIKAECSYVNTEYDQID